MAQIRAQAGEHGAQSTPAVIRSGQRDDFSIGQQDKGQRAKPLAGSLRPPARNRAARYTDPVLRATTILAVRHKDHTVMASDGQVTLGATVVKHGARKIRRLYNSSILAGFAGSAADSFALFARFEAKLEQYRGNLERSSVELAKDWRTDRLLRRLEAMM